MRSKLYHMNYPTRRKTTFLDSKYKLIDKFFRNTSSKK